MGAILSRVEKPSVDVDHLLITWNGFPMDKTDTGDSWSGLDVGRRVMVSSLVKSRSEVPSKITKVSSREFQLQPTRSTTGFPFQDGEKIRVTYTENEVLYCWDGNIDRIWVRETGPLRST